MNPLDIFWKISAGAKFDFKRFESDADKLKIRRSTKPMASPESSGTTTPKGQGSAVENIKTSSYELGTADKASCVSSLRKRLSDGSEIAEFEKLYKNKPGLTMDTAKLPANKRMNRYCDVIPYDTTLVKLTETQRYINASYININPLKAASEKRQYIATQGPLPSTVADFWQLVWEKDVSHIVMLTAETEKDVIKCHRYWPSSAGEAVNYGQLRVELRDENKTTSRVFRTFHVSRLEEASSKKKPAAVRVISQFHYLGWPDHGVPSVHDDFLQFVNTVCEACKDFIGPHPAVIHCSAGIGRTGVFIGIVTAMQAMKAGQPFAVLDFVRGLRDQRGGSVQTPDQYRFLCEAVLKIYDGGRLNSNSNNSSSNTQYLQKNDSKHVSASSNSVTLSGKRAHASSSGDSSGSAEDDDDDDDEEEEDHDDDDSEMDCDIEPVNLGADNIGLVQKRQVQEKKAKKKKMLTAEQIAQIHSEEVNHFRNMNHIHVYGSDIPEPIKEFGELELRYNVNPRILENLRSLQFHAPTVIEMQAVPVMMHRRELMACAPTGSGKTLAFVLPILHHLEHPRKDGFRALCLAPTRELAEQTCREFNRVGDGTGLKVHFIHSVLDDLKKYGAKLFQKFDILVTTPNRLVHLLQQDKSLSLSSVQWLVIDESDKLFEDGTTGFRDQLATIYKACDSKDIRRAMFSATFSFDVEEWCKLNLDNVVQVYVGARNSVAQTIEQKLLYVGDESGKLIAIRDMIQKGFQPPMLIFVQSKDRAKELFHTLAYESITIDVIHADKTQAQRDKIVSAFRSGEIWILICTDVMCRGMDFKAVNIVVNYDFPNSDYVYIHRIGRTGRAGRLGKAITFFTDSDSVNLRCIANKMREAGCEVPDYMLKMSGPSRDLKRKLKKTAVKREHIATDFEMKNKKRKMNKSNQKHDS